MSPKRLELRHRGGATPIWIGRGALGAAAGDLDAALGGRRIFVVTAPPILQLHRQALDHLKRSAAVLEVVEVADGEAAKSIESAVSVWRRLLAAGAKRDSCVVAFGGGVVGDLAGFVAGTLARGVDFVQIPTTLLAQIDAAIGGKTAINLPEAKNSVGVFHHPVLTIADTEFLDTLPQRQLRSGLFEVIKTAVVLDTDLFALVERRLEALLGADSSVLAGVVEATAAAKIRLVESDPREADQRRLLNLGHTLGHALESTVGSQELSHGEAVGYGMLFVLSEAVARGLPSADAGRIRNLVERTGLPGLEKPPSPEAVMAHLGRDKKARETGLAWVLPRAIGAGEIVVSGEDPGLGGRIARFLATIARERTGRRPGDQR